VSGADVGTAVQIDQRIRDFRASWGHSCVGTEHMRLGLVRAGEVSPLKP